MLIVIFFFFFFFQAEDGIRDGHVTGVQTCALPIFLTRGDDPRAPCENRQNPSPEPHPACAHGEGAQQSKNLPPASLGNPGRRKPLFLSELSALHHVQHGKRAVGLDPEREPVRGNHERLPPRERSGSRTAQARTASLRPRRSASGCRPAKTLPKLSRREF